jgi:beta-phosphoglucomutase-like phosphatase (HAD superfamily)
MPLPFTPVGAIFDCDGTLADTMPLHYRAWRETLDPLGCPFPEEQFYAWGGVTAFEIVERLNDEHGLAMPVEATALTKEENYSRLVPQVQPILAVVAEARRLSALCPVAVASGGIREVVEETLTTIGLRDLFPVLSTADDVLRGKPEPDIFLVAAERLGIAPEGCVVYEDSPAGIEAARRAGMKAVNVLLYL